MTDEEIVALFLDGETPYSIMRWHMRDINHRDGDAYQFFSETMEGEGYDPARH